MLFISSALVNYTTLEVNDVHQGSLIGPSLFNIYMEAVMTEVLRRCAELQIWSKL
jgi:hypothetical protein